MQASSKDGLERGSRSWALLASPTRLFRQRATPGSYDWVGEQSLLTSQAPACAPRRGLFFFSSLHRDLAVDYVRPDEVHIYVASPMTQWKDSLGRSLAAQCDYLRNTSVLAHLRYLWFVSWQTRCIVMVNPATLPDVNLTRLHVWSKKVYV